MAELMMSRREIRPLPVRMDATSPSSILPVQPTAMLPIGSPKRISPLDLRLSARSSRRPTYCSALGIAIRVLLTLITDSLVSIAVAWLVAYLLTLGNVFSGLPAAGQSYSSFMVATTMLSTLCTAQAMLLVQALSLTPLHLSGRPGKKIELLSIWWKLQQRCLSMFVVTEVVTGLFTYAVTSAGEPFSDWHLEYYAANWAVALHRSAAAVESKRIFQLDTVEGRARGRVNTSPYHVRLLRAYCSASFLPATMTIAGAVVQVSMRLRISTNRGLVLFSLASLALKSTALWATRTFAARRRRRIDIQSVYIYTVVPTVLINTQVRLFLLRTKPQLSISGFLALALIEPVLRAVKLIFIEREINRHHHEFNMKYSRPMASWSWHPVVRMASQIQTAHVAVASASSGPHLMFGGKHQQQIGQHSLGEIVSRTATSNLTPGQMFAQWRATVMQFHAAEIEAVRSTWPMC